MKKLVALISIGAGVLVAEHALVRLYRVWWVRWYPGIFDLPINRIRPPNFVVRDGLGRELTVAPAHFGSLFGRDHLWAGWGNFEIDVWVLLASSLLAYLAIRIGVLLFEKSVTR
jgi:hypothetical protein